MAIRKITLSATLISQHYKRLVPPYSVKGYFDKGRGVEFGAAEPDEQGNFKMEWKHRVDGKLLPIYFRVFLNGKNIFQSPKIKIENAEDLQGILIKAEIPFNDQGVKENAKLNQKEYQKLSEMAEKKPEEIQKTEGNIYNYLRAKTVREFRRRLLDDLKQAPEGLVECYNDLELVHLIIDPQPIGDFIRNFVTFGGMPDYLKPAALSRARQWREVRTLLDLLKPELPIGQNPLFGEELSKGKTLRMGGSGILSSGVAKKLFKRDLDLELLSGPQLEKLVKEKVLTKGEASEVGLALSLDRIGKGNIPLTRAIMKEFPNGMTSIKDLAAWNRERFASLLKQDVKPAKGFSKEQYAAYLQKHVEFLFPHATFIAQFPHEKGSAFAKHWVLVQPLRKLNKDLFSGSKRRKLNTTGLNARDKKKATDAYHTLKKIANRYAGLELEKLWDSELHIEKIASESMERMELLKSFYAINGESNFFSLDIGPLGKGRDKLDLHNFSSEHRRLMLNMILSQQRIYGVTRDAEHAVRILEAGFRGPGEIVRVNRLEFGRLSELPEKPRDEYYSTSMAIANKEASSKNLYIRDWNPMGRIDNFSKATKDLLSYYPGYQDLFGNQDYCSCEWCSSIYGPSAYFADLMVYIETHILRENFEEDEDGHYRGHLLSPQHRRPDLWTSVQLTCKGATEEVPYLTIINEVLSSFIAWNFLDGFDADPMDYPATPDGTGDFLARAETAAFKKLYLKNPAGIGQPVNLAMKRLDTYLEYYPTTRDKILEVILGGSDQKWDAVASARLKLSFREKDIIENKDKHPDGWLMRNYAGLGLLSGGNISNTWYNVKPLNGILKITRKELHQLSRTWYIFQGQVQFEIRGEADPPENIQPNVEKIRRLTYLKLDRMQRFVRVWKKVPWTIEELDLLLCNARDQFFGGDNQLGIIMVSIAQAMEIQEYLGLKPLELAALIGQIPIQGDSSFFDQLFNPAGYKGEKWDTNLDIPFSHPSLATSSGTESDVNDEILIRLLSGLQIKDSDLIALLEATAIGSLNLANLSQLYKLTLLIRKLRMTGVELLSFIGLLPGEIDSNSLGLSGLLQLIKWHSWWKGSAYSLKELEALADIGKLEEKTEEFLSAFENNVQSSDSLSIGQNAFTLFKPGTVDTTEAVNFIAWLEIKKEELDGKKVEFEEILADPTLPEEERTRISERILILDPIKSILTTLEGFFTRAYKNVSGPLEIAAEESRVLVDILIRSGLLFKHEGSNSYRLSDSFFERSPGPGEILPPAFRGTPGLPSLDMTGHFPTSFWTDLRDNYLTSFYWKTVYEHQMATAINASIEKTKLLMELKAIAPDDETRNWITSNGQGELPAHISSTLPRLIQIGKLFKSKNLDTKELRFIADHADGDEIFSPGFRNDQFGLEQIKNIEIFSNWLGIAKEEKQESLFAILSSFNASETEPGFPSGPIDPANLTQTAAKILGALLELDAVYVGTYISFIELNVSKKFKALEGLQKLSDCISLGNILGLSAKGLLLAGGAVLPAAGLPGDEDDQAEVFEAEIDLDTRGADHIFASIRAKFSEEAPWEEKFGPFMDRVNEEVRNAYVDFLMGNERHKSGGTPLCHPKFIDKNDLFHYFLLDPEMGGCARTSRVVAGSASLQMYVQRVLMNLEQDHRRDCEKVVKISTPEARDEWLWRKNYRVWEANRKVFLYPETYLEPDLRDNKTPLFKELENDLLQKQVDAAAVEESYRKYLKGFEEVASLTIAGACHESGDCKDVLHLFGATPSEPPIYYYRRIENFYKSQNSSYVVVDWGHWEKLALQIPVRKVSLIVHNGRLFVFWMKVTTRPYNREIGGSNRFAGYKHTQSVEYAYLKQDGSWSPPQKIKLDDKERYPEGDGVILDLNMSPIEESEFRAAVNYQIENGIPEGHSIAPGLRQLRNILLGNMIEDVESNPDIIGTMPPHYILSADLIPVDSESDTKKAAIEVSINYTNENIKRLFIPEFDDETHQMPRDDYKPNALGLEQVFPTVSLDNNLVLAFLVNPTISYINHSAYAYKMSPLTNKIEEERIAGVHLTNQSRISVSRKVFSTGLWPSIQEVYRYSSAERIFRAPVFDNTSYQWISYHESKHQLFELKSKEYQGTIISNKLSDVIISVTGDNLLLYRNSYGNMMNSLVRISSTLAEKMGSHIFTNGLHSFLSVDFQKEHLIEPDLPIKDRNTEILKVNPIENSSNPFSFEYGGMAVYYHEIFFHIPFLIANHLNSEGKYAEAQKWYHYIFDPTAPPVEEGDATDRFWQFLPFRDHSPESLKDRLGNIPSLKAYAEDPFNPHAIARHLPGAYQKAVVMKYIDNLIDWGDQLFEMDTMESINEAQLLYILAADILGPKPEEIGPCKEPKSVQRNYLRIRELMEKDPLDFGPAFESALIDTSVEPNLFNSSIFSSLSDSSEYVASQPSVGLVEGGIPGFSGSVTGNGEVTASTTIAVDSSTLTIRCSSHSTSPLLTMAEEARVFCVPPDKDFLKYWDRVEEQLHKIRHCMNIRGIRRKLPLFAPEIDPRLLVRARAAGLSLEGVLETLRGDIPPYRFSFLIAKAKEYAAATQSFGAALSSALDKKDAEELGKLRLVHQQNLLKMNSAIRRKEISSAEKNKQLLEKRKEITESKRDYYDDLIKEGLIPGEMANLILKYIGLGFNVTSTIFTLLSGNLNWPPSVAGLAVSTPTGSAAKALRKTAIVFEKLEGFSRQGGEIAGMHANFKRREEGWKFQRDFLQKELPLLDNQIEIAQLRIDIAKEAKTIHEKTIEQVEEVFEFYGDKFSNLGLLDWLSKELRSLYRQTYQDAMQMARLAERALRFERGDANTPLLEGSYWDASRSGLLAGEKLLNDLRVMEQFFLETDHRKLEIDQAFSVAQLDPEAIIGLKTTGECTFTIPEFAIQRFYPGAFRCKIRSARLSIPCVTGPYTNVSATLSLLSSKIRIQPSMDLANLRLVPPSRTQTIATSTAQNDGGVFNLNFQDSRYLPFEGAGVVESEWKISLPNNFRPFDYNTINDVIIHISYECEKDDAFGLEINRELGHLEELFKGNIDSNFRLIRAFSLRQEFSQAWHVLTNSSNAGEVTIELTDKHFPMYLDGRELRIKSLTPQWLGNKVTITEITITNNAAPATSVAFDPDGQLDKGSGQTLNLKISHDGVSATEKPDDLVLVLEYNIL
ncbi:MAG: hypothetical protein H6581_20475 [Bacteroidia bacterium]|nr:hypothetical protein [Bacteroidia bacterium]